MKYHLISLMTDKNEIGRDKDEVMHFLVFQPEDMINLYVEFNEFQPMCAYKGVWGKLPPGKFPPGQFPHRKLPPEQLPPRINPTRKISTKENSHPENSHLENPHPRKTSPPWTILAG